MIDRVDKADSFSLSGKGGGSLTLPRKLHKIKHFSLVFLFSDTSQIMTQETSENKCQ